MQKGILKLTKRPLVQGFFPFFSSPKPVALYLGQYSATVYFPFFYEAFGVSFKKWNFTSYLYLILSAFESEGSFKRIKLVFEKPQ